MGRDEILNVKSRQIISMHHHECLIAKPFAIGKHRAASAKQLTLVNCSQLITPNGLSDERFDFRSEIMRVYQCPLYTMLKKQLKPIVK